MEGDNIIGLKTGKQSISLETGGQIELSGAPFKTLHQTCDEINSHLYQVNLDFSSEADMIKKMRASLALQPVRNLI
ncbi:hypothetical protein TSUD_230490 [Trifolium subterraneum]|nr:hypothetical protein TSUD_230490 [Trifolium subterraneum]